MSDKVRYYLESSVKEIKDLKERKIFDQDEISKLMKRRTDFEHKLLSRGVKPEDFIAYAKFEMQFDRLRQLRVDRLQLGGKNTISDWAGPRRIVFTLERGTRRFPANLKLWMELVEYANKQRNTKVVKRSLTNLLRMHTRDPEVWVYVAKFQLEENASVPEARAVLQRGLRFNPKSAYLWLEYMRLELIYVAKIMARRKILGIERVRKEEVDENKPISPEDELTSTDLHKSDGVDLKDLPSVNIDILGDVESNPALRGDVALAVYDSALSALPTSTYLEFSEKALAIFDQFTSLNRIYLCSHILEELSHRLDKSQGTTVEFWEIGLPIRHYEVSSPEFPNQLKQLFGLYAKSSKDLELKNELRTLLAQKILEQEAEPNLKKAVELFVAKM